METKIYKKEQINEAAAQLKAGQLVAFPTETVFGLGAIATNEAAVSSVFATKGRPQDNPLIVHVSSIEQVAEYDAIYVVSVGDQKQQNTYLPSFQ